MYSVRCLNHLVYVPSASLSQQIMSACRGIELSSEGDLGSIASDRPPFTFAADPGSRRRMNVLAQSKAVLRRPVHGLKDGMSVI